MRCHFGSLSILRLKRIFLFIFLLLVFGLEWQFEIISVIQFYSQESISKYFRKPPLPFPTNASFCVHPPPLTYQEVEALDGLTHASALSKLSQIIHDQIDRIQQKDCRVEPSLYCGVSLTRCGFGCQVHHKIACLLLSYALNLPLIHDEDRWSYNDGWDSVFQHTGSDCTPSENRTLQWAWTVPPKANQFKSYEKCISESNQIFPLLHGIIVDKRISKIVENLQDPFQWMVGTFIRYMMRLQPKHSLQKWKDEIGFSSPIVGIHVRRTDKIKEAGKRVDHDVAEYMRAADYFFSQNHLNATKTVFVTSEDRSIIDEVRREYPEWKVIGFDHVTTVNIRQRKNALLDIVKDALLLGECDYAVCSYSSNICGMTLELIASRESNSAQRLRSLDSIPYSYVVEADNDMTLNLIGV